MIRVEIKTVDPSAMRYPTAGDWEWLPDGALMLKVPDYGGRDISVILVAIHEMIEAFLCRRDGISEEEVTKFDTDNPKLEEPGDDPRAPYHRQHIIAMALEREAAIATGTDWATHDKWVFDVGNAVERIEQAGLLGQSKILMHGARYWAELHMFALRNDGKPRSVVYNWFLDWFGDVPFGECPCKSHAIQWMQENPMSHEEFFAWTVRFHNAVNERIGKPVIDVDGARKLWETRTF